MLNSKQLLIGALALHSFLALLSESVRAADTTPPASWNAKVGELGDNDKSAGRLLKLWMERAWRRPASDTERAKFSALYRKLRGAGFTFDDALRSTFQSVLMGGPRENRS